MEPKYESYTNLQLQDVLRVIDREKFPERFEKVSALLESRAQEPEDEIILKNADAKKLVSPLQVFFGSYWGGPIYAIYSIRQNFLALGEEQLASKTVNLGVLLVIGLVALVPFIPESIPNALIPAIYGLVGKLLVEKFHLKKDAIANSTEFVFESNWIVFGKGTIAILLFFILIVAGLFAYEFTGILDIL